MTPADRARAAEELHRSDVEFMLRNSQSRRFLWWILQGCGIYGISYDGKDASAFAEGQRNVGLKIIADISKVAPTAYPELLLEQARAQLLEQAADGEPDNENH